MKRRELTVLNLLLVAGMIALSIGWWVEHWRFTAANAALDKLRTDKRRAEKDGGESGADQQPERRHIPLAGVAKGSANSPITIVEFADFQCPFCGRATATIDQVFKEYLGQVRFYVRHSPLPFHPDASPAAEAALAAEEQGKFWHMHDKLMANQRSLAREDLEAYAREIGLDMAKFTQALDAQAYRTRIEKDVALAEQVGARGTPTFYINGRMLSGAQPIEAFKAVIDEELARAQKLVASGTPVEKVYDVLTASAARDGNGRVRR
ncbi:MAG TPA: thioredoxin domain-containing protein [Pirellulaceae bacterium]|jgi:protein-disulfide isomerase